MASNRRVRPRTKVYDVNYDIGESYYKPTIDRLDQKYSPSMPTKVTPLNDRLSPFFNRTKDADSQRGFATGDDDSFDDEMSSAINRIRANQKFNKALDDIGIDSAISDITTKRLFSKPEPVFESNNGNGRAQKLADEIKQNESQQQDYFGEKKSRQLRLSDFDEEMDAIAERQAYREQRLAHLKNLVSTFDSSAPSDLIDERPLPIHSNNGLSSMASSSSSSSCFRKTRSEKKSVQF